MGKFSKKVVFITGASSGIGEAMARTFATEGAKIIATARRMNRLETLVRELRKKGTEALALACDVAKDGDLEKSVRETVSVFNKIDVVIANAGFAAGGPFESIKIEDYLRQFETNVFGVLRTIYASIEELKKTKGTLVLMGSVSGHISTPLSSPYTMSKYAVRALAESLHAELAPLGISVVLISPGYISSEIFKKNNYGKISTDPKAPASGWLKNPPDWLKMPADKAARKILNAVYKKKQEKIITGHGILFVWFKRFFPGFLARIFRLASQKSFSDKPNL